MHKQPHPNGEKMSDKVQPDGSVQLHPGEWYFGHSVQIRTLLGSCVAMTLWHPQKRIGGMCHYLLPHRHRRPGAPLDGRYGDEAVELLLQCVKQAGAKPHDFIVHLYGGADTLPGTSSLKFNVGERNIEQGWRLIDQFGFQLDGVDVGDNVPRHVGIDLNTGLVHIKRGAPSTGI